MRAPDPIRACEVVEVIRVQALRGEGEIRRRRIVTQWWTPEGELIAEHDPCDSEAA